jgi:hypothetical protein
MRTVPAALSVGLLLACGSSSGDSPPPAGSPAPAPGTPSSSPSFFPPEAVWYRDVSAAALDPQSAEVIANLDRVGWGLGRMQIDFTMEVLAADASTPLRAFTPTEDHFRPDCDVDPIPVPLVGAIEGEEGYECRGNGDCHLLVVDRPRMKLFEMWRADIRGGVFRGGCLAVWDMTRVYPPSGRGEQCTSADAAGFPIAPLLFDADEVAAGRIDHAIRFILPNSTIRAREYVHPATHGTRTTSGPPDAPPYGVRLRLRANYPLASLPNEGARTVARAMQRYGIVLADAGRVALTARSDRYTRTKWAGLLGSMDLAALRPRDFEMVAAGDRIPVTNTCVRNP